MWTDDEIEAQDAPEDVTYCHMIHPGFCSGRFSGAHTRFCEGGYEIPQGGYAWLMPGPWRSLAVEREREREETERAIRELDARDCRNINFYDGGDFNYGRGR